MRHVTRNLPQICPWLRKLNWCRVCRRGFDVGDRVLRNNRTARSPRVKERAFGSGSNSMALQQPRNLILAIAMHAAAAQLHPEADLRKHTMSHSEGRGYGHPRNLSQSGINFLKKLILRKVTICFVRLIQNF